MLSNKLIMELYNRHWTENITIRSIGPHFKTITLPVLDQDNDLVEIVIQKLNDGYIFSDGEDTLDRLVLAGVKIAKPENESLIKEIVNRYGLDCSNNEIYLTLSNKAIARHPDLVPATINTIVQCILAIEAAFYYTRIPGQSIPGSRK